MSKEDKAIVCGFLIGIVQFLDVTISGLQKEREVINDVIRVYMSKGAEE